MNIVRLTLVNRMPLSAATSRARKITTLGAGGFPTNPARFPHRPLEAARRTTRHPGARLGLHACGPLLRKERYNELLQRTHNLLLHRCATPSNETEISNGRVSWQTH